MAVLSLILSFLVKKLSDILQVIFGWSVTALFGRLPGKKQIAVTVALVVSIAWPVFLVGLAVPKVAGYVLAFAPLEKWVSSSTLRIVWGALAFLAPLLVGTLVQWAAPVARGGMLRGLLNGYPLALGFFVAFVVTAVSVPLIKLASILRGWNDEHVYIQPRNGKYRAVVHDLAEAFARAGFVATVEKPPRSMTLATSALRILAHGAVQPIVADELLRVRAKNVEAYIYPSDLLLRGDAAAIGDIRAMLTRTHLDGDAYLVGSPAGQCIQDELGRLIEVIDLHDARGHQELGGTLDGRLVEIWREMSKAKLPFDEWVMLESVARRVERRLAARRDGTELMPLDRADDDFGAVAEQANQSKKEESKKVMATKSHRAEPQVLEETPLTMLVRDCLDEAKELARIEVELAKQEAIAELQQVKVAAIGFGISAAASIIVLSLLAVALVLALGGTALVALAVAGGFLVFGAAAGLYAYSKLPTKPLEKTRRRLQNDMNQLKEHLA